MRPATALLALLLPAVAAAQDAPRALPSVDLPPTLERVLRDYERAWAAGDAAGLATLFTEDGFVLSNGAEPIRGRDAIRRKYANAGGPLRLRALGYATADTVGYIVGAYRYGNAAEDTGKFVLALRRGPDGRWLIAADIDNSIRRP
ncbi:MAG TPA: SgcJ/EcaC family oxidoreductase [Gemmatimonadales bacterium]